MSKITLDNFSVMNVQYLQYSFDYFLNSMKENNIKNIEFWAGSPHYSRLSFYNSLSAENYLKRIKKKLDSLNMKTIMYTPELLNYPFNLSSNSLEERNITLDYLKKSICDAKILDCNNLFINSGCGLRDHPLKSNWEKNVDSINKILELASEYNTKIVIEQLQPYESNLITNRDDLLNLYKEVEFDNLDVCLDVVAMEVAKENIEDYFSILKENIKHIHFSDGNPSGHLILGEGQLPLNKYINCLEKNNYYNFLTLEINDSIYWENPHKSIKNSLEFLRKNLNII
ncbi:MULTISPECIES: sugar phosphate isomerase/epimerase [unclassified Halanaerobium]|uniref:sugar phosphate isomerase/epimerase family protein n=1 Tax=unclassified Halanaerobium TaxID=2641197 RepID=UPI000DF37F6D|nr:MULTISPECIES: TIM barrel protein [unclassified Halanaerobium]RCW41547.1 protein FrlC [Halanaerobium sp. MA284_MarDTE_T2]RCW81121.1 protein FrlC [Halanaerobium sp. DL-01]